MSKTKEIKDENDLLGFIIDNKDENNDFNVDFLIKEFGVDKLLDFQNMVRVLQRDNCLVLTSTDTIHLYPEGMKKYVSPRKRIWLKAKPILTHVLSAIFGAILSNFDDVIYFFIKTFSTLFQ